MRTWGDMEVGGQLWTVAPFYLYPGIKLIPTKRMHGKHLNLLLQQPNQTIFNIRKLTKMQSKKEDRGCDTEFTLRDKGQHISTVTALSC